MSLANRHCSPIAAGTAPFTGEEAERLARETPEWTLRADSLTREWTLPGFADAMGFANQVADLAQQQDHHPDICISYRRVTLTLSTHKIGGLSLNDFIMAAKIDRLSVPEG
jgi:4a-hydroxytetrahydrobiopterin dehydratase